MTQEHIMKRRKTIAQIWLGIAVVALAVMVGLYIDETRRVQETYRQQFQTHLIQTSQNIDSYLNADGDFPLRYRRILSEMSGANSFAFIMTGLTEEQKIAVNELHTCLLKFPEQMQTRENLEAMQESILDMSENLDKGFEEASELVASINKKGF